MKSDNVVRVEAMNVLIAALGAIDAESGHDFSSDICIDATINDLDSKAIEDFRSKWIAKSGNNHMSECGY